MEKSKGERLEDLRETQGESYKEILLQLQERFQATDDKTLKIQILSVLPRSWSLKKVARIFNVPISIARTCRKLVEEQGIIPTPIATTPIARKREGLKQELNNKIISFYENNSRQLPGKKDYVTVREEGTRVQKQKMLVLMTLKELYEALKSEFPEEKVSFSKFAELRPKQCVLAGASGTHSVCVCIYHENFSLLIENAGFLKEEGKTKSMSMSEVLGLAVCPIPTPSCYLGDCSQCPGALPLRERMEVYFDERMQTHVEFKKWVSTDRSSLESCKDTVENFMDLVTEN